MSLIKGNKSVFTLHLKDMIKNQQKICAMPYNIPVHSLPVQKACPMGLEQLFIVQRVRYFAS